MIRFEVTPDGGEPYELEAGPRDILAWEKTGKGRSFGALAERQTFADFYALAHITAKRLGRFDGTLAEFEASCDVVPRAGSAEPDPTPSDP